jgi:hypothetical protein
MSKSKKLLEFDIYKEDTDPMFHQVAKLLLTSLGGWVAAKLIEVAYNAHFDLNDKPEKDKSNNA